MDLGEVAEYDTPLNLFDRQDSIFRSLCDEAGLTRADILKIRANVEKSKTEMTTSMDVHVDLPSTVASTSDITAA